MNAQNEMFSKIIEMMECGKLDDAKKELDYLFQLDENAAIRPLLAKLLSLCERHSVKVVLLSIPAVIFLQVLFMTPYSFLQIKSLKWFGEQASEFMSFFSFIGAFAPYVGIGWAKDKFPTIQKPAIPWVISIPFSIILTLVLVSVYQIIFVTIALWLNNVTLTTQTLMTGLSKFTNTTSLIKLPFLAFLSHLFLGVALLATSLLACYGPVSKQTSDSIDNINEILGNL